MPPPQELNNVAGRASVCFTPGMRAYLVLKDTSNAPTGPFQAGTGAGKQVDDETNGLSWKVLKVNPPSADGKRITMVLKAHADNAAILTTDFEDALPDSGTVSITLTNVTLGDGSTGTALAFADVDYLNDTVPPGT